MQTFVGDAVGRTFVLSFTRGDLLLEGIREGLAKLGIRDALVLSAVGSLEKVVYHRVLDLGEKPNDEFLTIAAPIEISSLNGLIANGEPHLHVVFSDLDNTYSGHLENGTQVLYLVELVIVELLGLSLKREVNAQSIKLLTSRG